MKISKKLKTEVILLIRCFRKKKKQKGEDGGHESLLPEKPHIERSK